MALRNMVVVVILPLLTLCSCGGSGKLEQPRETSAPGVECHPGAYPLQGHAALRVHLFDAGCKSDQGIVRWEWNCGEGWVDESGGKGSCYRTLSHNGTSVVHLRVTDAAGRKATSMLQVRLDPTLNADPVADAHADPAEGNAPLLVQFSAAGSYDPDGDIVKWEWDFGAGFSDFTATGGATSHVFGEGQYTATLRVTDDNGASATASTSVTVSPAPNVAPTAVANADPTDGYAPLLVRCTPDGSTDPDGSLVKWEWDFGFGFHDYSNSGGTAFNYFNSPGEYDPVLRVTDNLGLTATASVHVSVVERPNEPPTAKANGSPLTGVAPLNVSFNAGGSSDNDGSIVKWEWDFGSGFADYTSTSGTASNTFATAGTFTATLRITDDDGAAAIDSLSITVSPPPPPGWAHSYGMFQNDEAYSTVVDGSGNVYVAGTHFETSTQHMLLLAKYSSSGALQWAKTVAGNSSAGSVDTTVNGMALDPLAGGVVVLCTSNELTIGGKDFVLMKFGPSGTTFWSKTWGGSGNEVGSGVSLDSGGYIYATGTSTGFGGAAEVATVKFSPFGDLQWQRLWGSAANDNGLDLSADATGVYVLADSAEQGLGRTDPVLLHYTSSGLFDWSRGYRGDVAARSLTRDSSGLVLGGNTHNGSGATPRSLAALRVDMSGNLQWTKAWGNGDMLGRDVAMNASGIFVSGTANVGGIARAVVARLNADGSFASAGLWSAAGAVQGNGLALSSSNLLHLAGVAPNRSGSYSAATGSESSVGLIPFSPIGTSRASFGSSTWAFGVEDPPAGTQDTGGGGNDLLIIKAFQL